MHHLGGIMAETERLEGDALYLWAKLITEAELIRRSIQDFGRQELERRGYSSEKMVITNAGYIEARPGADFRNFLREGRGGDPSARGIGAGVGLDGSAEAESPGNGTD